jgi:hypothetical protein
MTNPSTPADDILAAMYNQANERLGHIIHAAMRAVFAADGFRWNCADTRQAIADAIRQIPGRRRPRRRHHPSHLHRLRLPRPPARPGHCPTGSRPPARRRQTSW